MYKVPVFGSFEPFQKRDHPTPSKAYKIQNICKQKQQYLVYILYQAWFLERKMSDKISLSWNKKEFFIQQV